MTTNNKKYCKTHHYFYDGVNCPFCIQERSQSLDRRFAKKKVEEEEKRDVTLDDIEKLKEKFGCR